VAGWYAILALSPPAPVELRLFAQDAVHPGGHVPMPPGSSGLGLLGPVEVQRRTAAVELVARSEVGLPGGALAQRPPAVAACVKGRLERLIAVAGDGSAEVVVTFTASQ
jgi:hypothetical protein